MSNMQNKYFEERLKQYAGEFAQVVPFEPTDKLLLMDFTEKNTELTDEMLKDTNLFIQYINKKLREADAKYGIGGYAENRMIYKRSSVFDAAKGPSRPSRQEGHQPHKTSPVNDPTTVSDLLKSEGCVWVTPPAGEPEGAVRSRREGEEQWDCDVKQDKTGYEHADPFLYCMLKEYALQNRSVPTRAEEALWQRLKTKKLGNYKFRRQHIIDKFITDFVCLKKRLVIEVDGLIHQLPDNKLSDEERTMTLNQLGFDVLRFTNEEVLNDIDMVLKKILAIVESKEVELPSLETEHLKIGEPKTSNKNLTIENTESLQSEGLCPDGLPSGKVGMGRGPEMGRTLHLGVDIWGPPYTKVMAPLNGIVHSFAFNNAFGDYGATIILTHNLDGETFHTLYGHLSLNSIKNIQEGDVVYKGDVIAEFGIPFENGQWPPHLHFQIIKDMQGMKGDYPGVCVFSEREMYLNNCLDADLILRLMQYAINS